MAFNLNAGQRAERKTLITVAEWTEGSGSSATQVRELLGERIPDSDIDYNADIETSTDIRGNNFTDVNKTQPQQTFDPNTILGGGKLSEKLNDIRRRNALSELNQFTVYIITAFKGDSENGYEAEKHTDCTIAYNSIGGEANVDFPYTVYFSNKITLGTVDTLTDAFTFTPDSEE